MNPTSLKTSGYKVLCISKGYVMREQALADPTKL